MHLICSSGLKSLLHLQMSRFHLQDPHFTGVSPWKLPQGPLHPQVLTFQNDVDIGRHLNGPLSNPGLLALHGLRRIPEPADRRSSAAKAATLSKKRGLQIAARKNKERSNGAPPPHIFSPNYNICCSLELSGLPIISIRCRARTVTMKARRLWRDAQII